MVWEWRDVHTSGQTQVLQIINLEARVYITGTLNILLSLRLFQWRKNFVCEPWVKKLQPNCADQAANPDLLVYDSDILSSGYYKVYGMSPVTATFNQTLSLSKPAFYLNTTGRQAV